MFLLSMTLWVAMDDIYIGDAFVVNNAKAFGYPNIYMNGSLFVVAGFDFKGDPVDAEGLVMDLDHLDTGVAQLKPKSN